MALEIKDLGEKLNTLTGKDFQACERACRAMADMAPILTTSSVFQAHVAAKALGVKYEDIQALPIKEYNTVTQQVMAFLFEPSEKNNLQ